jgi:hypothetical protein
MRRILLCGFGIWLAATIALRAGGSHPLGPDTITMKLILLVASAPLMFLLPRRLFKLFSIAPADQALGGILLVAPGMLFDTFSTIWFPAVFPNIRPECAPLFGGWLLFCNVVALLSAATSGMAGRAKTSAFPETSVR